MNPEDGIQLKKPVRVKHTLTEKDVTKIIEKVTDSGAWKALLTEIKSAAPKQVPGANPKEIEELIKDLAEGYACYRLGISHVGLKEHKGNSYALAAEALGQSETILRQHEAETMKTIQRIVGLIDSGIEQSVADNRSNEKLKKKPRIH